MYQAPISANSHNISVCPSTRALPVDFHNQGLAEYDISYGHYELWDKKGDSS